MCNPSARIMVEAFCAALESMAFITPGPSEQPSVAPEAAVLVQVQFADASDGFKALELVAGRSFGALLASNLLGEDAGPARAADVLGELMNVACGAYLSAEAAAGRSEGATEMGIPQLTAFDAAREWEAFAGSAGAFVLDAEGNTIAVRLRGAA